MQTADLSSGTDIRHKPIVSSSSLLKLEAFLSLLKLCTADLCRLTLRPSLETPFPKGSASSISYSNRAVFFPGLYAAVAANILFMVHYDIGSWPVISSKKLQGLHRVDDLTPMRAIVRTYPFAAATNLFLLQPALLQL